MSFLIGADPEVFVKTTDGVAISAHDLIPGTKKAPFKVENGAIQVDGTALEFNIEPAKDVNSFVFNVQSVMSQMMKKAKEVNPNIVLDISPSRVYNKIIFKDIPESALELGCDPDFNAYNNGAANPNPSQTLGKGGVPHELRTASGHVHVGWGENLDVTDPAHITDCCIVTKALDFVLYGNSLRWDKDDTRSKLYGKPGAFRPKPYGVEYRVLSNKWLENEYTTKFVYEATMKVLNHLEQKAGKPHYALTMDWRHYTRDNMLSQYEYYVKHSGLDMPYWDQEAFEKAAKRPVLAV